MTNSYIKTHRNFAKIIHSKLNENISTKQVERLSRLLAIDFLKHYSYKECDKYILECCEKIIDHLKSQVISGESAYYSFQLFNIAISSSNVSTNFKNYNNATERLIEAFISINFAKADKLHRRILFTFLKKLLKSGKVLEVKQLTNLVENHKHAVSTILAQANCSKTIGQQLIERQLLQIAAEAYIINNCKNHIDSLASKLATAAGVATAAGLSPFIDGTLIEALAIPTAYIASNASALIKDSYIKKLSNHNPTLKRARTNLTKTIKNIQQLQEQRFEEFELKRDKNKPKNHFAKSTNIRKSL